jgi:predicted DNA-binding transcriptional regulator AlpA
MAERFLKITEVCERYGVGPTWVYGQIKAGKFVEPVRLGNNVSRWPESKLDAFDKTLPVGVDAGRADLSRRNRKRKSSPRAA